MTRRRALGRGLDALLDVPSVEVRELPISELGPNRQQPRRRFDEAALAELAESIRAQGVVQPLVVTPADDGYTIIVGERRWRAAQRAGLDTVPAIVREVSSERQLLELALVENLQRADLGPLEEAAAYRRLAEEFGLSQSEIAERVGKGRSTVANAIRLLQLPEPVRELLAGGELTAGQARPLLGLDDEETQIRLARRARERELSARAVERLVKREKGSRRDSAADRTEGGQRTDPHTSAAAERLSRRLQSKVEIRRRGDGGEVLLHFHSEEELQRLFELLMSASER